MRFLIILFFLIALVGCGADPVKPSEVVKVPIVTKCEPKTNITPIAEDPADKMTKEMSLYEKLQLALASRSIYKGQNTELKAALSECTK